VNLLDIEPRQAELAINEWVSEHGLPGYRTRQILPRLWQRPVCEWSECTDLPKEAIQLLEQDFPLVRPTQLEHQESSDGTAKYLWEMSDGSAVESVVMLDCNRRTV